MIALPLQPQNAEETLQTLLDAHFEKQDHIRCQTEGCNQQVQRVTKEEVVNPESAIVLNINRQGENPMWKQVPEALRHLYPGIKINRRVPLPNTVNVPISGGGTVTYEVTSAIEHYGEHTAGGHWIAHLKSNGEWWTANDDNALRKSAVYKDYHPEQSAIILLKIQN